MSRDLSPILAHFGITEFESKPLALGYANENFRIDANDKSTMLRICKQQPVPSIQKEIELMRLLKSEGLKVAYPIPDLSGNFIIQEGEFPAVMYEFVDGHDAPINAETRRAIAREIAKLNSVEVPVEFKKENNLSFENCVELAIKFDSAPNQLPDVFEYFRQELELLDEYVNRPLSTGFVHGDVFPNNTIFQGNELKAIIDFEEFAVDTLLFDVAMTMIGFCLDDDLKLNPTAKAEFLEAYESVRPLTEKEHASLSYFIKWAALAMMSWHLENDLLNRPDAKQESRVRELMRIGQNVELD